MIVWAGRTVRDGRTYTKGRQKRGALWTGTLACLWCGFPGMCGQNLPDRCKLDLFLLFLVKYASVELLRNKVKVRIY